MSAKSEAKMKDESYTQNLHARVSLVSHTE